MTWTYTNNSRGYTVYKNGIAQGGAGTLDNQYRAQRRSGFHNAANAKLFQESAERETERLRKADL